MPVITVNLKKNPYKIEINPKLFARLPAKIKKLNLGNLGIVLTTPTIYALYKSQLKRIFNVKNYKIIVVCDGEAAKSQKYFFATINQLVALDGLKKKLFIICLGGGTIGDLGGFVAAIYKRGIPVIQVPTTLLAQIDSSIGGKTAIDLPAAKNILGAFYQPKAVYIDPGFLKTLPRAELCQGLAEAIKYGVIAKQSLFNFLVKNHQQVLDLNSLTLSKIITTCAQIKAKVVSKDETETKGLRTILNFGHTLGHAIESALAYQKINHGQAISIGMVYAAYLSHKLKLCSRNTLSTIQASLKLYNLPTNIIANPKVILQAFSYDKKFITGKIRMVLIEQIGKVRVIEDIPLKIITQTVNDFFCRG